MSSSDPDLDLENLVPISLIPEATTLDFQWFLRMRVTSCEGDQQKYNAWGDMMFMLNGPDLENAYGCGIEFGAGEL